jgi:hypothetical protein
VTRRAAQTKRSVALIDEEDDLKEDAPNAILLATQRGDEEASAQRAGDGGKPTVGPVVVVHA